MHITSLSRRITTVLCNQYDKYEHRTRTQYDITATSSAHHPRAAPIKFCFYTFDAGRGTDKTRRFLLTTSQSLFALRAFQIPLYGIRIRMTFANAQLLKKSAEASKRVNKKEVRRVACTRTSRPHAHLVAVTALRRHRARLRRIPWHVCAACNREDIIGSMGGN